MNRNCWWLGIAKKVEADLNASLQSVVEDFLPPDSPPLPSHEEFLIEEADDENEEGKSIFILASCETR